MNQFENHELVVSIYAILRDHDVLKNDAPLQLLATGETSFLEAIDKVLIGAMQVECDKSYDEGYDNGKRAGVRETKEAAVEAMRKL